MDNFQAYMDTASALIITYVPKLLLAVVVLIVGLWIIRFITRGVSKAMNKSNMDLSLTKFLGSLVSIFLKIMLLISVASMVGIATTSFVAVIGAAGLAVGLALQGSLGNFAGGVLILIFKPYKVGNFIEAQGYSGTVDSIQIFNTILKTPDNKTIIIPNGPLAGGSITNYSTEPRRRVDMSFGIGYGDSIPQAREVLKTLIEQDERILKDPAPVIVVSELGDSSVNFAVRVWCEAANYWGIYFDMQERVKIAFDNANISIPFPQTDVHLFQEEA